MQIISAEQSDFEDLVCLLTDKIEIAPIFFSLLFSLFFLFFNKTGDIDSDPDESSLSSDNNVSFFEINKFFIEFFGHDFSIVFKLFLSK